MIDERVVTKVEIITVIQTLKKMTEVSVPDRYHGTMIKDTDCIQK
jgi:predicted transcriptional regulator